MAERLSEDSTAWRPRSSSCILAEKHRTGSYYTTLILYGNCRSGAKSTDSLGGVQSRHAEEPVFGCKSVRVRQDRARAKGLVGFIGRLSLHVQDK